MVCSMSRFALESTNINFHDHIRKEHNPMSYLFFFNYILDKNQDDYTGLESYVREYLDAQDTGFIPINTCAAQNATKTNEENEVENGDLDKKMVAIHAALTEMHTAMRDLQGKVDSLAVQDVSTNAVLAEFGPGGLDI